jgi:small ligand-binding sensory domain FIST
MRRIAKLKIFPTVLIVLFVFGCASHESRQVVEPLMSDVEKEQGLKQIVSCLTSKIAQYDDQVSPPQAIAPSVAQACHDEIEAFRLNAIRGQSTAYISGFMAQWDKMTEPTIAELILRERDSRNEKILIE